MQNNNNIPVSPLSVGFAVSHLGLRIDLRKVLHELNKNFALTVYVKKKEAHLLGDEYETVVIEDTFVPTRSDRVAALLFDIFGKLPAVSKYYVQYMKRRADKTGRGGRFGKETLKAAAQRMSPYSYDFEKYLRDIGKPNKKLQRHDIVLGVTDVVNDRLYADIIASDVPFCVYVTSWDHAPKFRKFTPRNIKYLVWGKAMAEDLKMFHKIPPAQVSVIGCGQFSYLAEFLAGKAKENYQADIPDFPYIYVPASYGYPLLAKQEVRVITALSEYLENKDRRMKIIFRPYPILSSHNIYDPLRNKPNIRFDKAKVAEGNPYFDNAQLHHKYTMIKNARAVFHLGTTLGLEAAYFDTPVFAVDGDAFDDITEKKSSRMSTSLGQFHLRKYFLDHDSPNLIRSEKDFARMYRLLTEDRDAALAYNRTLRAFFPLNTVSQFYDKLVRIINSHTRKKTKQQENV